VRLVQSLLRACGIVLEVVGDFMEGIVAVVPGRTGRVLRRAYWGRRLAHLGRRVAIDEFVRIEGPEWIAIDDDTWIDRGVVLLGEPHRAGRETKWLPNPEFKGRPGELRIGKRCHIGPYCILSGKGGLAIDDDVTIAAGGRVYSLSHHYRSFNRPWDQRVGFGSKLPDDRQALLAGPVTIATNAGLGVDVLVLPGVQIGRGSFIAPRSVVRSSIPPLVIASGDPAEVRRPRYEDPPDALP